MKIFVFIFFILSINANAYCIVNKTNQNLLFMVEVNLVNKDSIIIFKQTIEANKKICKTTKDDTNKLSFYAFLNENAIEGCDVFGTYSSNIALESYQVFDNCIWESDSN